MTTPTLTSSGLDHRPGTFQTLADALDYAALGKTGVNFYNSEMALDASLSYASLRDGARAMAGRLAAQFPRGAHIGLIADTSPDFLVSFMACQYAGMISVPMSLPTAFGRHEAYTWQISKISKAAGLVAVMTPLVYRELMAEIFSGDGTTILDLDGSDLGDDSIEATPLGPDEPSYIQFSSGSTSLPKGVYATQVSVMANVHAITNEGLKITGDDRMVSWLPFYHDMGLIGFFAVPMSNQNSLDYISPSTFARRPGLWMRIVNENRCTITYSPSFGYGLASRRYRGEELDLTCLRVTGIGGDMIEQDVLDKFAEAFGPTGFDRRAFVASFGMAEVTLAASFSVLNTGTHCESVNMDDLQTKARATPPKGENERQRKFTACGVPLKSVEISIRNEAGALVGSREIGDVMLKGPSLAVGYYREGEPLTPLCDEDGWFSTGDMGYWLNGELVITGRSKDLILWNGKNIWPQDLEWVAQKVGGKRVSRAAAFDFQKDDYTTDVVLLVECGLKDAAAREEIKREIVAAVRDVVGVPFKFEFVAQRSLPVTSSGKLSRAGSRSRYLGGELTETQISKEPAKTEVLSARAV
ncbi:MAG: fatty acyl-AMP ligase [Litoreibacter sp.]